VSGRWCPIDASGFSKCQENAVIIAISSLIDRITFLKGWHNQGKDSFFKEKERRMKEE